MNEFNRIWNDETKVKDVTQEVLQQLQLISQENSPEWLYFCYSISYFFGKPRRTFGG